MWQQVLPSWKCSAWRTWGQHRHGQHLSSSHSTSSKCNYHGQGKATALFCTSGGGGQGAISKAARANKLGAAAAAEEEDEEEGAGGQGSESSATSEDTERNLTFRPFSNISQNVKNTDDDDELEAEQACRMCTYLFFFSEGECPVCGTEVASSTSSSSSTAPLPSPLPPQQGPGELSSVHAKEGLTTMRTKATSDVNVLTSTLKTPGGGRGAGLVSYLKLFFSATSASLL